MFSLPVSHIPDALMVTPKRSARVVACVEAFAEDSVMRSTVVDAEAPIPTEESPPPPHAEKNVDVSTTECDDDEERVITLANPLSAQELERTKTLRQLREMCNEKGLPAHGKKSDLVQRLIAA